jgi:hypothetical protein
MRGRSARCSVENSETHELIDNTIKPCCQVERKGRNATEVRREPQLDDAFDSPQWGRVARSRASALGSRTRVNRRSFRVNGVDAGQAHHRESGVVRVLITRSQKC